jgi:hypothetical protein
MTELAAPPVPLDALAVAVAQQLINHHHTHQAKIEHTAARTARSQEDSLVGSLGCANAAYPV